MAMNITMNDYNSNNNIKSSFELKSKCIEFFGIKINPSWGERAIHYAWKWHGYRHYMNLVIPCSLHMGHTQNITQGLYDSCIRPVFTDFNIIQQNEPHIIPLINIDQITATTTDQCEKLNKVYRESRDFVYLPDAMQQEQQYMAEKVFAKELDPAKDVVASFRQHIFHWDPHRNLDQAKNYHEYHVESVITIWIGSNISVSTMFEQNGRFTKNPDSMFIYILYILYALYIL